VVCGVVALVAVHHLTEKTYTIKVCRETIQRLETAKKAVAATNKAARRALLDDLSTELPDITKESIG
jgi:hypothetical protein